MDGFLSFDPHWLWIGFGLVLATLEMLVPGVYLIWLAAAAIVVGLMTFGLGLSLPLQVIMFVALSVLAVFSARKILRDRPITSTDPLLNQRGTRLVGDTAIVTQAFEGGSGRVKHGDSEWLARGPDLEIGTRVRITGSDGAILIVEPTELLTDASKQAEPSDEA